MEQNLPSYDSQAEEPKEVEDQIVHHPVVVQVGCPNHYFTESDLKDASGWTHVICKNDGCGHGRYFDAKTHKLENGEICPIKSQQ